jgi:dTMP kinase
MDEQKPTNGLVVIFEGPDGVGKTTQLEMAEDALKAANKPVTAHRIPGGTPIGEALREAMIASIPRPPMTDLYIALATLEALIEQIDIERTRNDIILLDRSPLSIAAYQIYGSGVDADLAWNCIDQMMTRIRPDLTFLYLCPPDIAKKRIDDKSGGHDFFESKPADYFERVYEGYSAAAAQYDVIDIDASGTIDVVHAQTMKTIQEMLKAKAL